MNAFRKAFWRSRLANLPYRISSSSSISKLGGLKKVEKFEKSTLSRPEDGYMQTGGRQGIHTEHLGHMLSDMQYLQRSYPDAKW